MGNRAFRIDRHALAATQRIRSKRHGLIRLAAVFAVYCDVSGAEKAPEQRPFQQFAFAEKDEVITEHAVHKKRIEIRTVIRYDNVGRLGQFAAKLPADGTSEQDAQHKRPEPLEAKCLRIKTAR